MSRINEPKTTNNNARRRRARHNQDPADWSTQNANAILAAIVAVSAAGGAIRFGYTKDQGGYALGILGDGDPYTIYLRPSDDVAQELMDIAQDWSTDNVTEIRPKTT